MRILLVNSLRSALGGAETYLQTLVAPLAERGHALALLVENDAPPGAPTVDAGTGLPVFVVGLGRAAALESAVAFRPDVTFVHGLNDPTLEAELLGLGPAVLFAHAYYGTCPTGRKSFAFPAPQVCTRTIGPGCFVCFLPRRCGGLNPVRFAREYRLQRAHLALASRYARVVVASPHMEAEYRRHGLARVVRIPIFPAHFEPDAAPDASRPPTGRVLFAGRLTREKGGHVLAAALPEASRALGRSLSLAVAGEGPERRPLERLVARLGVAAEFLGWLGPPQLREAMRGAELLAVPSTWPEPFGHIGIEAGCLALPSVAFAVGGIPAWLLPGVSGELAPADPARPPALAAAIVRALRDRTHYERLCRGAWEQARAHGVSRHIDALEALLANAIARP